MAERKFHIGQKVVALKDDICIFTGFRVKKGKIYTCDGYEQNPCCGTTKNSIYLSGLISLHTGYCEYCNSILIKSRQSMQDCHFAPIQEKRQHNKAKIDIKLLKPVEEVIDEPILAPLLDKK